MARRMNNYLRLFCALLCLIAARMSFAAEYHGQVTFGSLPVPGATVTAAHDGKKIVAVTNQQGVYSFPDLADGTWTVEVEMQAFATMKQNVVIAPNMQASTLELKMLPLDQIKAQRVVAGAPVASPTISRANVEQAKPQNNTAEAPGIAEKASSQQSSDGLLINGSSNNAANSPFSQIAAFGNNRTGSRSLYNGGIGVILDNSALNARSFSLSGLDTPKPNYNLVTGVVTLGGPLKIPHLLRRGPNFFVGYQWTRNSNASTQAGLMPDSAERSGDFSHVLDSQGQPIKIFDPETGQPFVGNVMPISPQAQALLQFYPLPNVNGNFNYNYQIPIVSSTHQDALQSRLDQTLGRRDQLYGSFSFQSSRTGGPNLFGFLDTSDVLGINTNINWSHRFHRRLSMNLGYQFSRLRTRNTPYFENRENVSGQAGIMGNNQDPTNWGPPALSFSSGITGLSDGQSALNRNETNGVSYSMQWSRDHHIFTFGGDFRRQEFNILSQQNPRGTFTFTGAATQGTVNNALGGGSAFADFLLGIPDASAVAFGNADKYLRESVYDAFITDDWRIRPNLTITAGIRWEYGAPITELFGRLVNLDISTGFAAAKPVVASNPVGPLTGQIYPSSLLHQDKDGFEPRIGLAWRPIAGSSLVVRAGYGIYDDTSIYQTIANQMVQQSPLSKSLSVENSPACPLTLANGFNTCSLTTPNTFAVDPNLRVGYAQNWQLSVQRDLPASLQMTATYLGIKGTRGAQQFLPNTYPVGAANPCPSCPIGFNYLTSNGNSTREAGSLQLRRRLHNGFTATLSYTYSKSIDDDSGLGGQGASSTSQSASSGPTAPGISNLTTAQNWLDLRGERGLSNFDQRHLLNLQVQYTTGMGLGGGTLLGGWRGALLKEWNLSAQVNTGTGLPETPIYGVAVPMTGVIGTIRPDYTGAPIHISSPGVFLNSAAYAAPVAGQWGNAARNSISGPNQFSLNASAGRTFRLHDRYNLDLRFDSTNLLNHVTYTTWYTTTNSALFGSPASANPMRSIQTTLRLRF